MNLPIRNEGMIRVANGEILFSRFMVTNAPQGVMTGPGRFSFEQGLVNEGELRPGGESVGDLFLAGTVDLRPTSRIWINLKGPDPVTGFGRILAQSIILGGSLLVSTSDDFRPLNEEAFQVLTSSTSAIKGQFKTVLASGSSTGLKLRANYSEGGTEAVFSLSATPEQLPVILVPPLSKRSALGDSVTLSVSADGMPPLSYQWTFNGTDIRGATNATHTIVPVRRTDAGTYRVRVTDARGTVSSDGATLVLVEGTPDGLEGDVSPQNGGGDGFVTVGDVVVVGQMTVGLLSPRNREEFMRADSAPRSEGGDGLITVADWVQTARYAAGIDSPRGMMGPEPKAPFNPASAGGRGSFARSAEVQAPPVRISGRSTFGRAGMQVNYEITGELKGNESGFGFSLSFDPSKLKFIRAKSNLASSGMLQVNDASAPQGSIGIILTAGIGQTATAGMTSLLQCTFEVLSGRGEYLINFSDNPVRRQVADKDGLGISGRYQPGIISVLGETGDLGLVRSADGRTSIGFIGEQGIHAVEASKDLLAWKAVPHEWQPGMIQTIARPPAPAGGTEFYRLRTIRSGSQTN